MYAYKKITHLKPNTRYQVSFSLVFASNVPKDTIGAGGAPGDSVYMKMGMISQKPARYIDSSNYLCAGVLSIAIIAELFIVGFDARYPSSNRLCLLV